MATNTMHNLLLFFFFTLYFFLLGAHASIDTHRYHHHRHHGRHVFKFRPTKLFVFGDSYADTGNIPTGLGSSWNIPYGMTFPRKPYGRFSDGRVLTDYVARFIGVRTPFTYKWIKYACDRLKKGMNFAYGGTGVFETLVPMPNMTAQIDLFQQMIDQKVYTQRDLRSSLALVSLVGNDYSTYLARTGSAEGIQTFIPKVVNQLKVEIGRLKAMGVGKVAVTALQPLGCLPRTTYASNFQECNSTFNFLVQFHNHLLTNAVTDLNSMPKGPTVFILDLYSAFWTVLNNGGYNLGGAGRKRFEKPLKPCCMGKSPEYSCGDVNEKGEAMYTVCDDPGSTFFWDNVHPTQAGWESIYSVLQATSLRSI